MAFSDPLNWSVPCSYAFQVLRDGAFYNDKGGVRCAVRDFRGPRYRFRPQGFRVVLFLQHLPAKRVATNEFLGRAGADATGLSV